MPALTIGNRETLEAKVEFHLEDELPPAQPVTGTPFAVGQELTSQVPALPYQIGLKMIVLDDPPVGILPQRRDVIPRQLHDLDQLVHLMEGPEDWLALARYVRRRSQLSGCPARTIRQGLAELLSPGQREAVGKRLNGVGPRAMLWEALATADDLEVDARTSPNRAARGRDG